MILQHPKKFVLYFTLKHMTLQRSAQITLKLGVGLGERIFRLFTILTKKIKQDDVLFLKEVDLGELVYQNQTNKASVFVSLSPTSVVHEGCIVLNLKKDLLPQLDRSCAI